MRHQGFLSFKRLTGFLVMLLLIFNPCLQGLKAQADLTAPSLPLMEKIKSTEGLIALWKFDERPGKERKAVGIDEFPLKGSKEKMPRINEGPLSGWSILLDGTTWLSLPHAATGSLNIHGDSSCVTMIAWIKWTGEQTGFVGGMWNEHEDGGKRQYGLFVSLPHYNGKDQVCGHISLTGKPTPPFPYSIDYSSSRQQVPAGEWCSVAFSYDGEYIRSYVNGIFEAREPELISNTTGFEGYPDGLIQSKNPYYFPDGIGDNGSDFTVGAVMLRSGMGNFFKGLLGGLAVFNRALPDDEIRRICTEQLFTLKNEEQIKTIDMTVETAELKKDIAGVLDAHWAAVKAKDADAVIALVTDDFLSCGSDPEEFWNKEEMYNTIKQMFAGTGASMDVTVDKREIRIARDGNSAIAFEQMFMKPFSNKLSVRTVYHLVKISNSWLIDFTSTAFIPRNEDIEKINKALE